MTDIRRIDFTCPVCSHKELYAERLEVIQHPLVDEIDIDGELDMSGEIAINEREYLEESFIRAVVCSQCGFEVVQEGWEKKYGDPAEPMVEWLEERGMLPKIKKSEEN